MCIRDNTQTDEKYVISIEITDQSCLNEFKDIKTKNKLLEILRNFMAAKERGHWGRFKTYAKDYYPTKIGFSWIKDYLF